MAQIARETGVAHNLVFKWLRLWQKEGRISRRLPATIAPTSSSVLLPVEVISDPTQSDEQSTSTCHSPSLNATSCHVEFSQGKVTLDNGKIAVAESDLRWCSDGLEFGCDDGEKMRVTFALDCCDREAIDWAASTGGYDSSTVQDVMLGAVEKRFGNQLPERAI